MAAQAGQQLQLFGGRIHDLALYAQLIAAHIQAQIVKFIHALFLFLGGGAAAQNRLDAGNHLFGVKGLYHIVVGPQLKAQHTVIHFALGGEHDNGHLTGFADLFAHGAAIHFGHHQIQQNQVRMLGFKGVESFLAVSGQNGGKALFYQIQAQKLGNVAVIIRNKDLFIHQKNSFRENTNKIYEL